jgi:cation diffusion facilitator family transporter
MSTEGGTRAVVAALTANVGIAASKFFAFAVTGSTSMLSEAIHSVADSLNQVLLLIGGKHARRKANENFHFGFGRVRYVYAFIVAIVLFMVGGVYSLYEGWHKWQHPHPVEDASVAVIVLVVAIILESFSFRTAVKEANKARGRRSLARFVKDARQPELPVIILEDFGALIGLILALGGVVTAQVTGDGRWDGLGALAIGTLLILIAIVLIIEMSSMLVGEAALPEEVDAVTSALKSAPLVDSLIHLRTLHVGPDDLLVAAKVGIRHDVSALEIVQGIDEAEKILRASVPNATYVFIEPDFHRAQQ